MIDMDDWIAEVKRLLDIGDRVVNFDPHPTTGQLFIHYYNLPQSIYDEKEGGGAERENNRVMLTVLFPGKHGWYEKPVSEGTLRISLSSLMLGAAIADFKLRGKTCSPEKMAIYVADYLNKVSKQVPPNYTHSKPPIA